MMEIGQDGATAKGPNYGAAALSRAAGSPKSEHRAAASVHANVDLPFRPLAPFVPEAHWQRLERPLATGWIGRVKFLGAVLLARVRK